MPSTISTTPSTTAKIPTTQMMTAAVLSGHDNATMPKMMASTPRSTGQYQTCLAVAENAVRIGSCVVMVTPRAEVTGRARRRPGGPGRLALRGQGTPAGDAWRGGPRAGPARRWSQAPAGRGASVGAGARRRRPDQIASTASASTPPNASTGPAKNGPMRRSATTEYVGVYATSAAAGAKTKSETISVPGSVNTCSWDVTKPPARSSAASSADSTVAGSTRPANRTVG